MGSRGSHLGTWASFRIERLIVETCTIKPFFLVEEPLILRGQLLAYMYLDLGGIQNGSPGDPVWLPPESHFGYSSFISVHPSLANLKNPRRGRVTLGSWHAVIVFIIEKNARYSYIFRSLSICDRFRAKYCRVPARWGLQQTTLAPGSDETWARDPLVR